jgi:hypothetical protein
VRTENKSWRGNKIAPVYRQTTGQGHNATVKPEYSALLLHGGHWPTRLANIIASIGNRIAKHYTVADAKTMEPI